MAKDENKESEIRGDEQEIVDQRLPVWRPQDADREYYRYETKKRIQHYTVPPQTVFRPAKPTPTIRDAEHKRVAVYARVSTKSKEQVSSIENQTKYYTEKIAKTPNWDLAEIYSDEGKSGTSKKWRPEFKRMLEDASKKKMDLIVCASVSRFARNISDLIEEVRKLRTTNPSNPVGVYFETEDLYTFATRMCESGLNVKVVQSVLGHADVTTTLDIYVTVTNDLKKREITAFETYLKTGAKQMANV